MGAVIPIHGGRNTGKKVVSLKGRGKKRLSRPQIPQILENQKYLIRVSASYFCAAVITEAKGRWEIRHISMAAPILQWAIGWRVGRFEEYCKEKGWKLTRLPT